MQQSGIKNIVIVGGGTAGWLSAALLVKILGRALSITLVESEQIGTVGVGEATIPPIIDFNNALGIDEKTFLKATNGTIKLGIEFENWRDNNHSYMHAFGGIGKDFPFCQFHHFWGKYVQTHPESSYWDYSLNYQAAKQYKFAKITKTNNPNLPGMSYAYHFDAALYAQYLRKLSESMGVKRIEGRIQHVEQNHENGFITGVTLENGSVIQADLFIDCSGMQGLLIDKTLKVGFEDWSHWLPCDRAIAVQSEAVFPIAPYTKSVAHDAGWRWRIPLQTRTGNGLVYSSRYLSDEQATAMLLSSLDAPTTTTPRIIPFKTGRRSESWCKNVVAIGLSSGFLEPLESTSIHLIQSAISRLLKFFPHTGFSNIEIAEFNRLTQIEIERIRDFIIMHYKVNNRVGSAFWDKCRTMDIPNSLESKLMLFRETGKIVRENDELFTEIAWQQVLIGQGMLPLDQHPLVSTIDHQQLESMMSGLKSLVSKAVEQMPLHEDYIQR